MTRDPADYLSVNRANWDSRAPVHAQGYGINELLADPSALSQVVAFDLPRLGRLDGLDVVHLQCHIGTDTLSLARLGGRPVGVDLSPASLTEARALAERAGVPIEYVEADVYSAPQALGGRQFDLVYAQEHPDRAQQPWISGPGELTPALELPYFEQSAPLVWDDAATYASDQLVDSPLQWEWNHGIGEIVTAVLSAGLELTALVEHDSVPWLALPGLMEHDEAIGEYRLRDRPERLPASFTLIAAKAA